MFTYTKCKDRSPQETVGMIQTLLGNIGVLPVVKWTEGDYKGTYSR